MPKARFANPRVSPDGKRLAVTIEEGSSANIWVYECATQRLARFPFPNGGSEKPLWTPDGKYLAFINDARTPGPVIYLMRADGTGMPHRLVEGPDLLPETPPQPVDFARLASRSHTLSIRPHRWQYWVPSLPTRRASSMK